MNVIPTFAALAMTLFTASASAADVKIANAWARATAPGQKTAVVYMDVRSDADAALVGATSPLAARVELHTMSMEGGVMRMRPLERVVLPARKTVKLAPNGAHLMLVDVSRPLKAGERVPLMVRVATGKATQALAVNAEVRALTAAHEH